jgi:hypothetical protein|tara:strand:- start:3603 stop:3755 length:153 start_codon:yes stop_codon:yes gene_type:complete
MTYYTIHAYVDGNLHKHLFGSYDMQEIKDEVQDLKDSGYKNITIEKIEEK